ncbi:MAG: 5-formyltetrahydrofolate cyclo-ligase [Pseudomonadota bacterium]
MSDTVSIETQKKELRRVARRARAAAHEQHGAEAGRKLAAIGLEFAALADDAKVSGYVAIRDEIDPAILLKDLGQAGHPLALPVVTGPGEALYLAHWLHSDALEVGDMGIPEPVADSGQASVLADCMLVPLLAVDRRGYRLGYGGGFYDRTIEALQGVQPVTKIGLAFDEQIVDAVPHDDYDQRLDWILTPSGPIKCQDF